MSLSINEQKPWTQYYKCFLWRPTSGLKHKGHTVHWNHKPNTAEGREREVKCQLALVMETRPHKWKRKQSSSRASQRMAEMITRSIKLPSSQIVKCGNPFLPSFLRCETTPCNLVLAHPFRYVLLFLYSYGELDHTFAQCVWTGSLL